MSSIDKIIKLQCDANKEIQKAMAVPLKKLEGMLALERQKDGTVKTVFAGSRDYSGSKTETKNS